MTVARGLRRYLSILVLEEEQAQAVFEAASAEVRSIEARVVAVATRERDGRQLVTVSLWSGDTLDRIAALEHMAAARRAILALRPILAAAIEESARRREAFLAKRVQRRQAETLIAEAEALAAVVASRRDQQSMDEMHLSRACRKDAASGAPVAATSKP